MYLIFPESIIIPEVSHRREDYDFEDWLTAALIENANQDGLNANASSARGITDLWMLEIAERNGRVWRGNFHVEFDQGVELEGWGEVAVAALGPVGASQPRAG